MSAARDSLLLLGSGDPDPVEWINPDSAAPVLLVCEHAGQHVPQQLHNLGLERQEFERHIGWDIGAAQLARRIAAILQAPLILQRYSRLVIDCNRPPGTSGSVPSISDDTPIEVNATATDAQLTARQTEIFDPFNQAIHEALDSRRFSAAFSIHSFTPSMGGTERPWHAGFLSRTDLHTATLLMNSIASVNSQLSLALNQPYQIDDETDWFIPQHAEKRLLTHCLIEIRNDQLIHTDGIVRWADLLSGAIQHVLETQHS